MTDTRIEVPCNDTLKPLEQLLRYADLQVTRWDVPELVADFGTRG